MNKRIPLMAFLYAGFIFCAATVNAQVSFTNQNVRLNNSTVPNFHSGCAITVADMNGDGLDDIVRLSEGHDCYIEYQQPGDRFTTQYIGDFSTGGSSQWGMCVADVDHNGYKDVLAGGGSSSGVKLMKIDANGLMGGIVTISTAGISGFLMQNANFMDVNSDGWADIFVCDDNNPSHIWVNDMSGNFNVSNIIDFNIHNYSIGSDPADAGNYGSVWTDFDNDGDIDLFIAKCRQGVSDIADPRRIDVLFVNDGNDNYTQMDSTYGVADSLQSWTSNFADIDNDGDLDLLITVQNTDSRILENNGSGYYTDISSTTGFNLGVQPIESVMEDFDNDGYVDILVTGANSELWHNHHDKTFTLVSNPFDGNEMESFACGDLNHDGKIDIYAGYAGIYTNPTNVDDVVWINTTDNNNNFITVKLTGTITNKDALGARAMVYSNGMKQLREVHSGESYGTCNTADLHFGLGTATTIDSIVIRWAQPSTQVTVITNPAINQFLTVIEGDCVSPDNVVTSSGPMVLCTGQTLTLNAAPGYTYLWSNGETTQSITVSTAAEYSVKLMAVGNNCTSYSAAASLVVDPVETPTIAASSELEFCAGGSVTLQSSGAASYLWSDGTTTTQSIIVTQSGTFSVSIPGACQSWTSVPVQVTVYSANAPLANDVTLSSPGTTTLTALGNNISWYDAPVGGNLVATGGNFLTPFLSSDTVFYAEDATVHGHNMYSTGIPYSAGLYSGNTTNAYEIFDVLHPCILKTVKVYTDTPGDRIIELRDNNNTVLQSALVTLPVDSSIVTLNFNLVPGTAYRLGTNTAQNNTSFGYNSPRLQRENSGVTYPYVISNYISINTSSQNSTLYYYFYDWQVEDPGITCISDRTPVHVFFTVGIPVITNNAYVRIFPNPANGIVSILFDEELKNSTLIELTDMTGRIIRQINYENLSKGQSVDFNLNEVAAGTYFVNVQNEESSFRQQLIITQ